MNNVTTVTGSLPNSTSSLAAMTPETTALHKLDKARQILAEARTVSEAKQIRDQAEALRVYAQEQKYSLECLNYCTEIKIRAERKAGELLAAMRESGQRAGRGDKEMSGKTTLEELGITRDQSSQWQRVARIDEQSFEGWIAEIKDAGDRLSTAGLMEAVGRRKENNQTRDRGRTTEDFLLRLAERIDDLRRHIVRLGDEWKPLLEQYPEEMGKIADAAHELVAVIEEQPRTEGAAPMKAHQRAIREQLAAVEEVPEEARRLAQSLDNAEVREITDKREAQRLIERYEWLRNMGNTQYAFGLYFGPYLAGVACFGDTAGNRVYASVCGAECAEKVITLVRGACVHWAHPHSASFLIPRACKAMAEKYGYNVFVAYSDTEAGEIGTVYQACNWLYVGTTGATEKFRWPHAPVPETTPPKDGKWRDARMLHGYTVAHTKGPWHVLCRPRNFVE